MAPGACLYGGCNVKPYNANMPWAVGASNARLCKLPVTSYFWYGCPPQKPSPWGEGGAERAG